MNFRQIVTGSIFVGAALFASFCHAGWSSGGGELIRDANNPWFLSNTKDVKYCIKIDEKNFGQTKQQVRERIAKAFQFWQMQFKDLQYFNIAGGFDAAIATQNFKEENCTVNTDVVFQFGVLTAEQKEKLKDLSRTIGITVRTDYDEVNMKGKGFVYIAPEAGDLKPAVDTKIDKMWSSFQGTLLFPVLIHEIGHIFGLQHDQDVSPMGEDFVDGVFSDRGSDPVWWTEFEKNEWLTEKVFKHNPFAKPWELFCAAFGTPIDAPIDPGVPTKKPKVARKTFKKRTSYDIDLRKFFNVADQYDCLNSYIQEGKFVITAKLKDQLDQKSIVMGEMNLQATYKMFADKSVVKVWFTEKQKIIPDVVLNGAFSIGSMHSEVYYKGNYVSLDGKTTRRIVVTANPNGIKNISGTLKGEIYQSIENGF